MPTIEAIHRQIDSAQDLQSIVRTMKAFAAVSIHQYQRAVISLSGYTENLELAFQVVLRDQPDVLAGNHLAPGLRLGAIVFGSDQGLCGQFNEKVGAFALDTLKAMPAHQAEPAVLAVGVRAAAYLEAARQPVQEILPVPGNVAGITPIVQEILVWIEHWRAREGIDRVTLFYNNPVSNTFYRPLSLHLLPLDVAWLQGLKERPWPTNMLPAFTMDWDALFSALVRQYLFVSLYRALAESLASENASRLASMQAAENNIEDMLGELNGEYHQLRQTSITEELLDIVSGFEALNRPAKKGRRRRASVRSGTATGR
jgi:F-type H+-transporting ATPase subunit gamma